MKSIINVLTIQDVSPNPFIRTLSKGIATDVFQVDTNQSAFWNIQKKYDIIQVHWPELFFYSRKNQLPTKDFAERLSNKLNQWRRNGAKIVFTRHDETTHYVHSLEVRSNLYEIIESKADVVVHLGYYSKNKMVICNSVDSRLHVVIPHHIYDTYYQHSISQSEARKILGISEKFKVILCFGTFRAEEENMLVKNAFEQLSKSNSFLLAPGWYHDGWHEYVNKNITLKGNCFLGRGSVDRHMLPCCFAVADVIFIHRLRNLNSGNLSMGFLFNKTIVGPAIGNMTEYLDNIHNFTFDPFNPSSVVQALHKGLERSQYPQMNEAYAREHWSTARISEQYRQLYQRLIE
jgi:glycosyltransferase involved in cell wall biosynthesis